MEFPIHGWQGNPFKSERLNDSAALLKLESRAESRFTDCISFSGLGNIPPSQTSGAHAACASGRVFHERAFTAPRAFSDAFSTETGRKAWEGLLNKRKTRVNIRISEPGPKRDSIKLCPPSVVKTSAFTRRRKA